jgi:hypothetical protein
MRIFPSLRLLWGGLLVWSLACGGEDDSAPPPAKNLTPKKTGGAGGVSGKGGSSGENQGGSSAAGGSSGDGGSSEGGSGGNNAGGSSGNNAGGSSGNNAGGSSGNNAGGSSGNNAGGSSGSSTGGASGSAGSGGVVTGKCNSEADCGVFPDRPLCNPDTRFCVACLGSSDCTKNPDEKVCEPTSGLCIECQKDADCSGHANGPHCDIEAGRCTCKSNSECAGSPKGQLCDVDRLRRCSECLSAFDCKNPQKPGCDLANVCFRGDFCAPDDIGEGGDDGPLGASDITPPEGDPFEDPPPWFRTLDERRICDLPVEETDWYRFTAKNRDSYEISLSWQDASADLDLVVLDGAGNLYGYNYHGRPARVQLTYLPAGTYYAFVYRSSSFDKISKATTPYAITAKRMPEAGKCSSKADCASTFAFQLYRGTCDAAVGVCRPISGNGQLGEGAHCDDDKDCLSGLCSYQPFTRNAHERSFCTRLCDEQSPCPSSQRCATYLLNEMCVDACEVDDECNASTSSVPPEGKNWAYLICNKASGNCE